MKSNCLKIVRTCLHSAADSADAKKEDDVIVPKVKIEEYHDDQWMVCHRMTIKGVEVETLGVSADMYDDGLLCWENLEWAINASLDEALEKRALVTDVGGGLVRTKEELDADL
jgi:hypothetical protein